MVFELKILTASYVILRGLNTTVWGGVEGAKKTKKIIKTNISSADFVIGTSHALEDFACNNIVCASIDVMGIVSTAVGLVLRNIFFIKHLTVITGSVTVKYFCKKYNTFRRCTIAAGKRD